MKLNHVLIKTTDLDAMTQFWTQCIGLKLGARPPFPYPGAWLYSDGEALIHIVEDSMEVRSNGVLSHVALEAVHYGKLVETLKHHNFSFSEMDVPQSDQHQVFINGPDGLCVEMIFRMSPIATELN